MVQIFMVLQNGLHVNIIIIRKCGKIYEILLMLIYKRTQRGGGGSLGVDSSLRRKTKGERVMQ